MHFVVEPEKFSKEGWYSVLCTCFNYSYIVCTLLNKTGWQKTMFVKIYFPISEDVGFMRDTCVDVVARNLYNKFKYPVSRSCEELGE